MTFEEDNDDGEDEIKPYNAILQPCQTINI